MLGLHDGTWYYVEILVFPTGNVWIYDGVHSIPYTYWDMKDMLEEWNFEALTYCDPVFYLEK